MRREDTLKRELQPRLIEGRPIRSDELLTTREQAIELLNATHDFPCAYVLKVIGVAADDFVVRVVLAVREEIAGSVDPPYRLRCTPAGKHVSITFEPTLESAEQVLGIYDRMRAVNGVVLTM